MVLVCPYIRKSRLKSLPISYAGDTVSKSRIIPSGYIAGLYSYKETKELKKLSGNHPHHYPKMIESIDAKLKELVVSKDFIECCIAVI